MNESVIQHAQMLGQTLNMKHLEEFKHEIEKLPTLAQFEETNHQQLAVLNSYKAAID